MVLQWMTDYCKIGNKLYYLLYKNIFKSNLLYLDDRPASGFPDHQPLI